MVASGFLPCCIYKNKIHFLFGKEAPTETDAKGWSDFAGGVDKGETDLMNAGIREATEELTGFLGDISTFKKLVQKNGGTYNFVFKEYHIHIFKLDYDPKLVEYFNNTHHFIYTKLDPDYLKSTKIFEKIEIAWMTATDAKKRRNEFRPFYREILDALLKESSTIRNFLQK
jgi:8-oxo-dGTP pyrophosphatase MutT (NUDIX family)